MPRILWMASSKRRGFTLVEMSVVIALVALFASIIVPNLIKRQQNQAIDTFFAQVFQTAKKAREMAITKNLTLHMKLEGSRVTVTQDTAGTQDAASPDGAQTPAVTPGAANSSSAQTQDQTDQNGTEVLGLDVPDAVSATKFQLAGMDSSSGDFDLRFYPDGTTDGGGIEFTVGDGTEALNVSDRGAVTLDDQLEDPTQTRWSAGEYVQR